MRVSSLTTQVKKELTKVTVGHTSARYAELASIIRFAGKMDVASQKLIVEMELDHEDVVKRASNEIQDLFGLECSVMDLGASATRKSPRYLIRVSQGADTLVRKLGLVTRSGHRVIGLPPQIITGTVEDAEAAWRGAFMAAGQLSDPGRASGLEVSCPCQEASLALVGCARRLGLSAKTKETRGVEKVTLRDGDAVGALLTRMGAHSSRLQWDKKRLSRETKTSGNHRLANFDDANLRRSARAAVAAAARVERAMAILGDDVPDHLAEAGQLRVQYREASLEELGRYADPQMTKDAVAGRIRRLLSMADKRAEELGIPDTQVAVTDEILNDI